MRIVAGTAGGRRLRSPTGLSTRPTTDRVREAVFNALSSAGVVDGARVVDLFAGSGALGIEALSRGAAHAVFVDVGREACEIIRANLDTVGLADTAEVVQAALPAGIDGIHTPVDLVLADPPYDFDEWPELLGAVADVAAPDAWGAFESDRSIDVGSRWEKMRERAYGGTVITYASVIATGHSAMSDNATGADP